MSHDRTAHPPLGIAAHLLTFIGPLAWAVLVLFHPLPEADSVYEGISDVVDRWLVVHIGQLILTPFLFLAVWRLLDGLSSVAATVSRCALVVWTVFFSAYDSIQGIATGVLAGAGRAIVVATAISTVFALHTVPAAIGLIALCVAAILRDRRRTTPATGAPAGTEGDDRRRSESPGAILE